MNKNFRGYHLKPLTAWCYFRHLLCDKVNQVSLSLCELVLHFQRRPFYCSYAAFMYNNLIIYSYTVASMVLKWDLKLKWLFVLKVVGQFLDKPLSLRIRCD